MAVVLSKGDRLSLQDDGEQVLNNICVGVSWGAIVYRNWLGMKKVEPVDLDLAVAMYHKDRSLIETICYDHDKSSDGAVIHHGDDKVGDLTPEGRDFDNEVVTVDLSKLRPQVAHLVFMLNSFEWNTFDEIPYIRIRIYEGQPGKPERMLLNFDVENDKSFAGKVSMILGKVYRAKTPAGMVWRFHGIGEATPDCELDDLRRRIAIEHLSLDELTMLSSSVPKQFLSGGMNPAKPKTEARSALHH
ncbi:TerD family protein [Thiolapillus sp.]|uniref:TerD family protein n=3 Tax=Thiolapillus sp. TaxID=2017437 RepID=UPI003AF4236B